MLLKSCCKFTAIGYSLEEPCLPQYIKSHRGAFIQINYYELLLLLINGSSLKTTQPIMFNEDHIYLHTVFPPYLPPLLLPSIPFLTFLLPSFLFLSFLPSSFLFFLSSFIAPSLPFSFLPPSILPPFSSFFPPFRCAHVK